jgi:hypothetical protein
MALGRNHGRYWSQIQEDVLTIVDAQFGNIDIASFDLDSLGLGQMSQMNSVGFDAAGMGGNGAMHYS